MRARGPWRARVTGFAAGALGYAAVLGWLGFLWWLISIVDP